jgi:uncharacterized protein YeeX (DUF496 family)
VSRKNYQIVHQGQIIHQNLSIEECAQILDELSSDFYENKLDPNDLKVEES